MTHFLARLVERTRGEVPRVEPIVAPRFAAAAAAGVTAPEAVNGTSPALAREAQSAPNQPIVRQPHSEFEGPTVAKKKSDIAVPRKETTEPVVEVVPETLLIPRPEKNGPAAPNASPRTRGSGFLRRDVLPHVQTRATESSVGASPARPRTSMRQNPVAPATDTGPVFPPNEPTNERPIVRVTIGRIEVRAAPAPVAPTKKAGASAAPKLTLDAYLQSRKEGAR